MIRKDQLDTPINELHPEALNTQTTREFIRSSELEFGLDMKDIDNMPRQVLENYINFLDDLWNK